jgi:hypothetical protein
MPSSSSNPPKESHLIVSDQTEPAIKMKPGKRFEVHSVVVVDEQLKASSKVAARLCGGTSTCLALVEI